MCFYIRNTKKEATLYEALQDITCYKILDSNLRSPYYNSKYEIGKLKTSPLRKPRTIIDGNYQFKITPHSQNNPYYYIDTIEKGLHSYQKRTAGVRFLVCSWLGVFKCIIPKGALFYRDDVKKEYVSDKLIVIKKV